MGGGRKEGGGGKETAAGSVANGEAKIPCAQTDDHTRAPRVVACHVDVTWMSRVMFHIESRETKARYSPKMIFSNIDDAFSSSFDSFSSLLMDWSS